MKKILIFHMIIHVLTFSKTLTEYINKEFIFVNKGKNIKTSFYIKKFEVTQEEYQKIMGNLPQIEDR